MKKQINEKLYGGVERQMKRSEILCPECFKKKLLLETEKDAYCDGCGTQFHVIGKNTVKYK